ncbi:hypothetical protein SAMN04487897_11450 [Paenibacillus sp. yr247]|uniref:hypothetical protein n=1 Tax=Paenibacillus sp. yr247 TaxID=1761880 RepID=UPI00088F7C64|nr:hypothetical protein [Paenibacillus sp. yr247]SDO43601.1 hypothetical protein SAMN04487897_11450 [Paenibacillus sp. yr247]
MYSIHFHIRMLDNKLLQPTPKPLPGPSVSDLQEGYPTFQHSLLIAPIDKFDSTKTKAFPSGH